MHNRYFKTTMAFFLCCLLLPTNRVFARSSGAIESNSPAEQWILEQVPSGGVIDLAVRFPNNEEDRVLRAAFLEHLLETLPVTVTRNGIRIKNAVFTESLEFDNIRVEPYLELDNCEFRGDVDFQNARFNQGLSLSGSLFWGEADFYKMYTGQAFFMSDAVFHGAVDFGSAQIVEELDIKGSRFNSPLHLVNFNNMRAGGVFMGGAWFYGPVDFTLAEVGNNFEGDGAQFKSTEGKVEFGNVTVENSLVLNGAEFNGPVSFNYIKIGGALDVDQARFNNESSAASFNTIDVGGTVFMRDAIFAGPVDFGLANIGTNLTANNARFANSEKLSVFDGMKVGNNVNLDGVAFAGPVYFGFVDVHNSFVARQTTFGNANLNNMVVGNLFHLSDTYHNGGVTFRDSSFSLVEFHNVHWPDPLLEIQFQGMTYKDIHILPSDNTDSARGLLKLLGRSTYSPQSYSTLEDYFVQEGDPERAEAVYIAYKKREANDALQEFSPEWWWNKFLDIFISFGKSPERAMIWGAGFILIGVFVFRKPEGMISLAARNDAVVSGKARTRRAAPKTVFPYNAFWYSFDLFIPFIDLGYDNKWAPRPDRKWASTYAKIQLLAGWILVPIGLLAISGVIK